MSVFKINFRKLLTLLLSCHTCTLSGYIHVYLSKHVYGHKHKKQVMAEGEEERKALSVKKKKRNAEYNWQNSEQGRNGN